MVRRACSYARRAATVSLAASCVLARLVVIGLVIAAVGGTFLYLGGWLTPSDLTPARFTDAFEHVDGVHAGFRRNHAKGVGVSGYFEGNGRESVSRRPSFFDRGACR